MCSKHSRTRFLKNNFIFNDFIDDFIVDIVLINQ